MNLDFLLDPRFWIDLSWGFFLSGIALLILSLLGGEHGSHNHDVHHDIGHDVGGHDVSHDVGHVHGDLSHIEHIVETGVHGEFAETGYASSMTLYIGTFLLMYGGSGIALFTLSPNTVLTNVMGMIIIAIVALVAVNLIMRYFFKTGVYLWNPQMIIGRPAIVVFEVTDKTGTIKVDTNTPLGIIKFPARSAKSGKVFKEGSQVWVVDYHGGIAYVDDNPPLYLPPFKEEKDILKF